MSNSNETRNADLKNSKTGWSLTILIGIGLVIVGFYFFNFNSHILKNEDWWNVFQNLSADTGNWGTFGDYVGGILNPVIAAFAFYLIRETYKLQKRELKLSTDALNDQVKLAALTALISTNLARIDFLNFEKTELLNALVVKPNAIDTRSIEELGAFEDGVEKGYYREDYPVRQRVRKIYGEIKSLTDKTNKFEEQIEVFLKEKSE